MKDKNCSYIWIYGIHFNVHLEEGRQCIFVMLSPTTDGNKELIAISDGYRVSDHACEPSPC